jgi:hypothetical protein
MTAVIEMVIRAPSREEATDALRAHFRTLNLAHQWDTSDRTCERLLAWLRMDEPGVHFSQ